MLKRIRIIVLFFLLIFICLTGWKLVNVYSEAKEFFPEGITLNGIDVRGMNISLAKKALTEKWNSNKFVLTKKGTVLAKISDFDYEYEIDKELAKVMNPNPITTTYRAIFNPKKNIKISMKIKGNPESLLNHIKKYDFLNVKASRKTKDAEVDLNNTDFNIIKEIYGNNIDKDRFLSTVKKDISKGKFEREYKAKDFYELPKVKSMDKSILEYQNWCKSNLTQKITFKIFNGNFTLTPKQILMCYDLDKNLNKKINEKGPDKVAWDIANKHNTRYKNRKFIPHGSKTPITIWGGDYGWVLNQKYTAEKIREALNLGRDSEFEMKYKQEPYYKGDKNDDIGKSYIEISIGRQTLWLVKNGKSVFSTDVVTGKPNHYTPLGAYFITQKATNATLKGLNDNGTNYESKVSYWMPFNGGIGCHDAHWRSSFGGSIYLTNGSHGCVNLPVGSAAYLFDQVEVGFPVIVYE